MSPTWPQGTKNFGIVPLDEDITQKQGVKIIGVDCGQNFSNKETIQMAWGRHLQAGGEKDL